MPGCHRCLLPSPSLASQVPVYHLDARAVSGQAFRDLLGDGDAAVLPAGAADRQRDKVLSLALVSGQHDPQRRQVGLQELGGARLAQYEFLDRLVLARPRMTAVWCGWWGWW